MLFCCTSRAHSRSAYKWVAGPYAQAPGGNGLLGVHNPCLAQNAVAWTQALAVKGWGAACCASTARSLLGGPSLNTANKSQPAGMSLAQEKSVVLQS